MYIIKYNSTFSCTIDNKKITTSDVIILNNYNVFYKQPTIEQLCINIHQKVATMDDLIQLKCILFIVFYKRWSIVHIPHIRNQHYRH